MSNAYSDMKNTKIKVILRVVIATIIPILANTIYTFYSYTNNDELNYFISLALWIFTGLYALVMFGLLIDSLFIKVIYLNIDGNDVVIYAGIINFELFINDKLVDYKTSILPPIQLNTVLPIGSYLNVDIMSFNKTIVKANNRIVYFNGKNKKYI